MLTLHSTQSDNCKPDTVVSPDFQRCGGGQNGALRESSFRRWWALLMSNDASHDFATTRWTLVVSAGRADAGSAEALAELCRRYWYPIYAYARRRSGDVTQAQDATQEFFARLLEKGIVALASPERGRFRSFLLTA